MWSSYATVGGLWSSYETVVAGERDRLPRDEPTEPTISKPSVVNPCCEGVVGIADATWEGPDSGLNAKTGVSISGQDSGLNVANSGVTNIGEDAVLAAEQSGESWTEQRSSALSVSLSEEPTTSNPALCSAIPVTWT